MPNEVMSQQPRALQPQLPGTEPTVLEIIQAAVADPRVDPAKLSALLDLKVRMDAIDAEREFNVAFAQMHPRFPAIRKDGTVCQSDAKGGGKLYSFARWDNIQDVIDPILREFGFTLSFTSEPAATGVLMVAHLRHKAGHGVKSHMQLPADTSANKNNLQGLGSARSYGKRYLTLDLLDLKLLDMDDDGRKGGGGFVSEQQLESIQDLIAECGIDKNPERMGKFLGYMRAKVVSEIHAADYKKAITALESARRGGAK